MFCRTCGNELREEAVICPKCGCEVERKKSLRNGNCESGNKWLVGFITDDKENTKRPYVSIYFQDENQVKTEAKTEVKTEVAAEEFIVTEENVPF